MTDDINLPELPKAAAHVHSNGDVCLDRPIESGVWPVELVTLKQAHDYARDYASADRAQRQAEQQGWQHAIQQEAAVLFLSEEGIPKEVLGRIIQANIEIALDPLVSPEAQALIDQGRQQAVPQGWTVVQNEMLRQLCHYTECYLLCFPACGAPTEAEVTAALFASTTPPASKPVAMIESADAFALAEDLEKIRQAHAAHWATYENHIVATAVRHLHLLAEHNGTGVQAQDTDGGTPSQAQNKTEADMLTIADRHGTRWRSSDEEGISFEKSAFFDFCTDVLLATGASDRQTPAATTKPASEPAHRCPDNLLPDGPVCPQCGGKRGPSGIDGGSWVHVSEPAQDAASVEGLMELVLHYGEQEHACLLQEAMDAYAAIRAYAQRLKEGE